MEILQQKRALDIIVDLFRLKPGKSQYVKTAPQKIPFPGGKIQHAPLPRSTPEAEGMRSGDIEHLFNKLSSDGKVNLHTVTLLRHGKIIAEMAKKPYTTGMWHATHSMCKTVTSLAVGMLIDEGKLSLTDEIAGFFPEIKLTPFSKYKSITVYHLLTMSSGVSFAEVGSVTDEDWVRGFFESAVKFEPGTEFAYNSMNSYILSAIVTKLTGQTLSEYLAPRLWTPLGITTYHWESCPRGITKGGWGLYLLPEDMAKIGELIRRGGEWGGKRLVSREWVESLSEKTFDTPRFMGKYGYSRHAWCGCRRGSVVCNGLYGQNIMIYPDIDVVIVTTAANDALFQTCRMTDIIDDFFSRDGNFAAAPLPKDPKSEASLREFCRRAAEYDGAEGTKPKKWSFFGKRTEPKASVVPEFCRRLDGNVYKLGAENVSIMPLLVQLVQNNYDVGVDTLSFEYSEARDTFAVLFGYNGRIVRVPVGFIEAARLDNNVNGEIYRLAITGEMAKNEDDVDVLKLRIACLELPAERRIKIFFNPDGNLTVKWSELPGRRLLLDLFDSFVKPTLNKPIIGAIAAKTDGDFLLYTLDRVIEPTVTATPVVAVVSGKD